jgi:intein/homing endonuclease
MKFHFGQGRARTPHGSPGGRIGKTKTTAKTKVTANIGGSFGSPGGGGGGGGSGGGGGGSSFGHGGGNYDISRFNPVHDSLEIGSVIEDWMPRDQTGLNQLWRLIYLRDAIVGPAVDLYSNLPYSECRLTGIDDPAIMQVYKDTMERLDIVTMMPELVREFLMIGRFCSSLIFDRRSGVFTDWTTHDPDFLRIEPIPVRGFDPKIDLVASPALKNFLHSMDPRDVNVRDSLPPEFFDEFEKTGTYKLNPLNTLFVPRRANPYDYVGTSFLTRIVSFWALEKSLIESTVTNARRRTRSILHITAGLDNLWEPTEDELEAISGLFIQADEDPVGAVVTTRTGVETNEVKAGADFWKLSDEWAFLTEGKMRALGISDAFLSGDACVSGDTLVQTDKGLIEIEKIGDVGTNETEDRWGTWREIDGLSVSSHNGPSKVVKWLDNGVKPVLRVTNAIGNSVEVTGNHPMWVLRDGAFEMVRADSLSVGDLLCSTTKPYTRSVELTLKLSNPVNVSHGGQRKVVKKPETMTPELAFLLGLVVSEGSILPKASQVRFSNSNTELLSVYDSLMYSVFGLGTKIYLTSGKYDTCFAPTKKCYDSIVCSKTLVEWLTELGCYSGGKLNGKSASYHKIVPWSVLQADPSSQMAFVAGFLEGDGNVNLSRKSVQFISSSHKLVLQMNSILASNGIAFGVIQPHGENCYRLVLGPRDTNELVSLIPDRFRELPKVSIASEMSSGAVSGFGAPCEYVSGIYKTTTRKKFNYSAVSYEDLEICEDRSAFCADLISNRYFFTPVESIEDVGEKNTYCLTLEDGSEHLFAANSIMVSNTYNNMETALSVFMESLRTLRAYMDRRVFYEKIFATIARVHGFTKPGSRSHGRGPRRGNTVNWKQAHEIPREDLLMPKIVWDKKLQPEGDMNFLEMLQSVDEAGVPVTLKQWASGAGLNLEEMMEELGEDSRYRTRIAEWRKQFTGDQALEQEVMSSLGLRAIPVWDRNNRFLSLSSDEALDIIEHFVENKRNLSKLSSPGETLRTISGMVDGNPVKTELMAYLLRRLGVSTVLPMEESTYESISEHLFKIGTETESSKKKKAVHAEFETLAKMMSPEFSTDEKESLLSKAGKDVSPFSPSAITGI